jgi:hypothetical protein
VDKVSETYYLASNSSITSVQFFTLSNGSQVLADSGQPFLKRKEVQDFTKFLTDWNSTTFKNVRENSAGNLPFNQVLHLAL